MYHPVDDPAVKQASKRKVSDKEAITARLQPLPPQLEAKKGNAAAIKVSLKVAVAVGWYLLGVVTGLAYAIP